ncbi:MAG: BirA family transcriptional regulator [Ilumatobacteraceae bacterium]|jgi:BirA family biotin operon repressor/biotin-[acetyl-CoA-carboxylase] ligase
MTTPGATWQITIVDETGSTNADLAAAAASGAANRSVLMARHQTSGKGRLDRRWEAPPGTNLLVSLLFREVPEHPHQLTQRVALAASRACSKVAGVAAVLKWPNDLLLDDRKLAGVLAQSGGTGTEYVVVGIGLNIGWAPEGAARLGDGYDPVDVLDAMLVAYDDLPDDITDTYRANLATIGQSVRVELSGSEVVGRALDVLPDGRLVVLDECGITHRFDTGDIVHLR